MSPGRKNYLHKRTTDLIDAKSFNLQYDRSRVDLQESVYYITIQTKTSLY